ncbi:hypothetical protein MASR2M117_00510 [Paludibacter sp.]
MNNQNKTFTAILTGLNLLFIIYYIILAIYSRPHYDDLHFLWKLREMSIFDYVKDMYFDRSGRFMGYYINGLVFKTILLTGKYWFFPILFGIIGVILTIIGTKRLLKLNYGIIQINAVLLFYNLFVLTNIDFPVFFWLCAMSYYLLVPAMICLIGLLLTKENNIFEWALMVVLTLFLGGGQEAFTPIVLFVFGVVLLALLRNNNWNFKLTLQDIRVKKIIVISVVMIIALLVVIVAPGNYNRLTDTEQFKQPETLVQYIRGFVQAIGMFFYFITFSIPYYAILSIVLFIAFGENIRQIIGSNKRQILIISIIVYSVYLLLSVFPSVYLWGGFGIQRNYTHLVFISMLFFSFWMMLLLNKFLDKKHITLAISSIAGLIFLIVIMVVNIHSDSKSAKEYAKSVDGRIINLIEIQANNTAQDSIVTVTPILKPYTTSVKYNVLKVLGKTKNPKPVLYYTSDTDLSPNEYSYHFTKFYNFDFQIQLERE